MPRDGLSQYAPPPGTNGITNYTIESTKYNGFVADVTQDLNLPRPIVAGGTGANNARDAMTSLQGDVAYQVVTNYDTYAFVSGSFYSAAGATSAPTGNAFIGQCYTSDPAVVPPAVPAGQNMFIEARDVTTGLKYVRQKVAGVWINSGAWAQQAGSVTDTDTRYVNVTGDTMTGALTVSLTAAPTTGSYYFGNTGGKFLGYDGTNYLFTGGNVSAPNFIATGFVTSGGAGTTGFHYFGNTGTKSLSYDGANFNLAGGSLNLVGGNLVASGAINGTSHQSALTATTGTYYFGNSGTKYLTYDGTSFTLLGGNLLVNSSGIVAGNGGLPAAYYFGNSGTRYLTHDGTLFTLAGGNLLIGPGGQIPAVNAPLQIAYTGGATQYGIGFRPSNDTTTSLYFYSAGGANIGSISHTTTTTAYNTASSADLKEDLKSFDAGNIVDQTNVYDFKWKSSGERAYGVIAQQAIDVYPTAVTHSKQDGMEDDFWGVDYSKYVPVLLQEIKALRARVAALETK
jgi:hypothetical protein